MVETLAELKVDIRADTAGLKRGLDKSGGMIKQHSKAIGMAMTAMGGAIVATGLMSVKAYANMGDEVHKMALRTGFATETLSRLKYAAAIGGASLQDVEKAAKRMAMTLLDAKDGLAETIRSLDHLGISVEDFEGLNPEEQFMKLAGAIAAVVDPTERAALAQKIFGRAGTALLPMLSAGTAGLKEMMEEAEKFSTIFDKDAAEAAAKLTDVMGQLKGSMDKVKMAIAEQLIPILIPLLEGIRNTISSISVWTKANPELTRVIVLGAMAIGGLLLVLGPLMIFLPSIIAALPILGAAFAALLGPVGIAIAVIVALIAVGWLVYNNWEAIKKGLLAIWTGLKDWAITTWDSIKQTVMNAVNFIIAQINTLIKFINMIPGINIGTIAPMSFEHGGVVPGPIGQPVPIIAHGGEQFAGVGGSFGSSVNVYVAGSVVTERDLQDSIREAFLDVKNRNTTTGF